MAGVILSGTIRGPVRALRILYPWLVLAAAVALAAAWFVSHYWQGGIFCNVGSYNLSLSSDMGELELEFDSNLTSTGGFGVGTARFNRSQNFASLGNGPTSLKKLGFSARRLVNGSGIRILAVVFPHWLLLLPLTVWLFVLARRGKYPLAHFHRGFEVQTPAR